MESFERFYDIIRAKSREDKRNTIIMILAVIGFIAAVAGIAYAVYRYPDDQILVVTIAKVTALKIIRQDVGLIVQMVVIVLATAVFLRIWYSIYQRDNMLVSYVSVVAKEGERVAVGGAVKVSRNFADFDAAKLAREAVDEALFNLGASPVPSGSYRVIIDRRCMPDLLSTFSDVFSAEAAQKGLSLLAGREGEVIAAPCVTLMDDPHMKGGLASAAFDAEGVATKVKAVIANGTLTTLLHNLKTARKAGVPSTGNASRYGYASSIGIEPSNFYFKPGNKTLAELMQDMGEGLVITEVSGLHAGANPVSGDFSLLSKGYTVEGGKKGRAVEQITVAGNFYEMLKNIRAFGSDLEFVGSPVGSPSVDVGEMNVAGQ
ncbi:MAG: TldD/PmbA family protein [Clostridia bacterium]|nr:TldD/PmbA family protein [Clostridia bacterium]